MHCSEIQDYRTGRVCLSASDTWYGKAIRKLTGSNVNHAFFAYYSDIHVGWQALQIDERGVVEVAAESLKHSYIECYEFREFNLTKGIPEVRKMLGASYDFLGIVGILFKLVVWRLLGRRILSPLHKKGDLFCSEFVTTLIQRVPGMYGIFKCLNPAAVAPGGDVGKLGTPSLQATMQVCHGKIIQRRCPWEVDK